jgi:choline monooxygenase
MDAPPTARSTATANRHLYPPLPMQLPRFEIDAEIGRASTPPAWVYRDPAAFEVQRERIFARSWQLVTGAERARAPGHVLPFTLLEGCLDEPLVLACGDDGVLRCLSNVCTHRGALVVEGEGHVRSLKCRYHGRRRALRAAAPSWMFPGAPSVAAA